MSYTILSKFYKVNNLIIYFNNNYLLGKYDDFITYILKLSAYKVITLYEIIFKAVVCD